MHKFENFSNPNVKITSLGIIINNKYLISYNKENEWLIECEIDGDNESIYLNFEICKDAMALKSCIDFRLLVPANNASNIYSILDTIHQISVVSDMDTIFYRDKI